MKFAYRCPNCGPFDSAIKQTRINCRCGREAQRVWAVSLKTAFSPEAHWDPVVGQVVNNQREFNAAVEKHRLHQEKLLGREVTWTHVDARDTEGICEVSGVKRDDFESDLEPTRKVEAEKAMT